MTASALATLVLRADAGANVVLAVGVVALRDALTAAVGLASPWPPAVLALLLLANGALCWVVALGASPSASALRRLAEVDVVFTAAVLGLVLADPWGAAAWLRLGLVGLAVVVAAVAATKLLLARRLVPSEVAALQR